MSVITPPVDIVITSFNTAKYIDEAIRSVLMQKYSEWNIIFVDDCSTDNTIGHIKASIKKNKIAKKCKLFVLSENCGYGMSLKTGIERGKSPIIFIVDSDDCLSASDALSCMVHEHLLHPEISLLYSDYYECNQNMDGCGIVKCRNPNHGETYLGKFSGDTYLGSHLKVSHLKSFKREHYDMTEGLNANLTKAVDTDLILKLEEVGNIRHIPKALYRHRKHVGSISQSFKVKSDFERQRILAAKSEMYLAARNRRIGKGKKK